MFRFERDTSAMVTAYTVWRDNEVVGRVHQSWQRSGGTGWAFSMTSAVYPTRRQAASAAYAAYQRNSPA